jgi:hypothetical protein
VAWTHANWVTRSTDADRLAVLKQHLEEVSQKIDVNVEADGLKANRLPVKMYYDGLLKEHDRLERRVRGRSRRVRVSYRAR